jgi:hypothetical protein
VNRYGDYSRITEDRDYPAVGLRRVIVATRMVYGAEAVLDPFGNGWVVSFWQRPIGADWAATRSLAAEIIIDARPTNHGLAKLLDATLSRTGTA